jgi:iron complex outermembrane receptor protein
MTLYADLSRGFRSGGFNQTGVGEAVPAPGVSDIFDQQISDTFEVGAKGSFWDGRASASLALYYTEFEGAYFFYFDAGTSTQNLGSIDETNYMGLEFEANAAFTDNFSAYVGLGYTDSEIQKAADPSQEGNQAPLVSEYTLNLGAVYRQPVTLFGGMDFVARADFARTGETWWEPDNYTSRSPIDVLDMRIGFEAEDNWSVTLWGKNVLDEEYNTEFSPGGFIWPALPARFGLEFSKRF